MTRIIEPSDDVRYIPAQDPESQDAHINLAKSIVLSIYNERVEAAGESEDFLLTGNDVYIVWFAYTLGNWKALVSTTVDDGRYYEVTHNHAKNETYLDTYFKVSNITYKH